LFMFGPFLNDQEEIPMKYAVLVTLIIAVSICTLAQQAEKPSDGFGLVSTAPSDGSTNVSTSTSTVVLTFSEAIDTTTFVLSGDSGPSAGMLTNLDAITGITFSGDRTTVTLSVSLSSDKSYFVAVFTAKSAVGEVMAFPYTVHFTTGSSFPPYSVSGTVVATGSSGVSGAYALVAATRHPIGTGNEDFVSATQADAGGNFTLPNIGNDTLYLVSAKDLNNDGTIDPSSGDPVGLGPQVVVNGTSVSGVIVPLSLLPPVTYEDAIDSVSAHMGELPGGSVLRQISAYQVNSDGGAGGWEFYFLTGSASTSVRFNVETIGCSYRQLNDNEYGWVSQWHQISSFPSVSAVDTFLARAERNGGGAYRPQPPTWNGFDVEVQIGSIFRGSYWDMIADTTKLYLGVSYWYGIQGHDSSTTFAQMRFVGDYTDGTILGTTAVSPGQGGDVPASYSLNQNYPNPFNPSTVIGYDLPVTSRVSLEVYNILGEKVATLVNGIESPGAHQFEYRPQLASGIYFYRIEAVGTDNPAHHFVQIRKMVLLK
jgi:hypothetical protein